MRVGERDARCAERSAASPARHRRARVHGRDAAPATRAAPEGDVAGRAIATVRGASIAASRRAQARARARSSGAASPPTRASGARRAIARASRLTSVIACRDAASRRALDDEATREQIGACRPARRAAARASAARRSSAASPCAERDQRRRPGCRCRRSRRTADAAAPASPCRTSSGSVPRSARGPRACVSVRSSRSTSAVGREIAEVVRGQRRQQAHPDVGRRGAARQRAARRLLLIVVGRQPGVGLGDERLEVAPRLARGPAQQRPLAVAERTDARPDRHAEPVGDRPARSTHSSRNGAATRSALPATRRRSPARRRRAMIGLDDHVDRRIGAAAVRRRGRRRCAAVVAAVSHSSSRRFVTTRRTSVRPIACDGVEGVDRRGTSR